MEPPVFDRTALTQANVRRWLARGLTTTARIIFKSGGIAEGFMSDEAQKPCAALFTITSSNREIINQSCRFSATASK